MKLSMFTAAALAAGLAFAGAVSAQPPAGDGGGGGGGHGGHGPMAAVRQVCMADIQKACPDAKPGPGGGVRECIVAHHTEFSQPCQDAIAQMRAARQQQHQGGGGESPAPQ
jgi:hypothetical protein